MELPKKNRELVGIQILERRKGKLILGVSFQSSNHFHLESLILYNLKSNVYLRKHHSGYLLKLTNMMFNKYYPYARGIFRKTLIFSSTMT